MSTQALLPFPCRKPRSLASKLDSVSKCILKSPLSNQENTPLQRETLKSISNFQNGGGNSCIRSIMSQPKSPRKRFGDPIHTTEGWSNDDFLNEIFKLSPGSSARQSSKQHRTPTKMFTTPNKMQTIMSPTRAILSPIRALSLNSPCKYENVSSKNIDSKTSKILQLKLARISIPDDDMKLPPDETPTKSIRVRGKAISFSERKTRKTNTDTTPSKPAGNRRVTRSAKKTHKLKLFNEDDFKENEDPEKNSSPSPRKRPKPSPVKIDGSVVCRELLPPNFTKPKAAKALLIATPEKSVTTPQKFEIETKNVQFENSENTENIVVQYPSIVSTPRTKRVLQLHRPEGLIYQHTKRALHSSVPDQLVGREKEIATISQFISNGVNNKTAGSLYISGAPGTGKSACLMKVLGNNKVTKVSSGESVVISVNCMSMRNSTAIYTKIATELGAKSYKCKTVRSSLKFLETALTSEGPAVILFLDEMDQLDSKNQEVLYTIFEWPAIKNSRLLLIGIANALDLTDRILPRLQSKSKCKPTLINFQPYSKDQIVAILEGRIKQTMVANNGERVIDSMAVQFCARKVSAVAGDARKALDICRRAVEVVETNVKSQHVLSPSKENGVKPVPKKVGMQQIASVLSGIYESAIASKSSTSDDKEEGAFPLQQKLAICTLILLSRHVKCKEVTMGKLHEAYTKICKKRQVTAVGQSEFSSLIQLVETRGIISMKANKQARMMKVSLALQEKDVEFAMQDKTLLSAILMEGLPK